MNFWNIIFITLGVSAGMVVVFLVLWVVLEKCLPGEDDTP